MLERTGGANVERIVLMGGAIAEGNMTPAAEFNIWADPEAAQAVFQAGIDTTMIGLDVTHRAAHDAGAAGAAACDGSEWRFVADLVDFFTVFHRETYGWDGAPIHDAVAVAEVIRPGLVTTVERNVEVELDSELCRGRTVVDRWLRTSARRMPRSASTSTPRRSSSSSSSASGGSGEREPCLDGEER